MKDKVPLMNIMIARWLATYVTWSTEKEARKIIIDKRLNLVVPQKV